MNPQNPFDFWYAINNTELLTSPSSRLETFGDTIVNYYLISELMDSVDKVRIREGQLKALKPQIVTPQALGQIDMDDFGSEARKYADWLAANGQNLRVLQYGFRIQKQERKEYIASDGLENVIERVKQEVRNQDDPLSAILVGVDDPWEVCLLKLMVDLVQHSAEANIHDLKQNELLQQKNWVRKIDDAFLAASRDPSRINALAQMLREEKLWEQYQDRFFALVRSSGSGS